MVENERTVHHGVPNSATLGPLDGRACGIWFQGANHR